ncbi:hypothetical protein COU78_02755 [Candidatus Peregrinibacteria bacterium CG10_big_fil_rev_8_21_14_0_10_49_24]|nr:MAG: hypothetical protein COV83_02735 [Candidatus Peregrinibacteria bacterium CG11_big_fil_rev_8_21_14_0_20_49_14]PIR51056.1 MAG: hypothetical protein COU78_02755 [Candidatus Peregrinibacteria bacterium CG10_big_fil_rev_8_21_14_0_10_49_24]PJA67609.1 MAG: hypothetical protein CO157_04235 [Candidatus Peregrinibacteria bacterium CG_4_9_14_3_um_filter_49_12]
MTYLLIGNYGVSNLGDEALRDYFLRSFPEIEWQVVSACPTVGELHRLPAGLRSFFSFRWIPTLRALYRSDGVVLGGGSLFTDIESPKACFLWWIHTAAARLFRKKIILAFQGIGPFHTLRGKMFARRAVRSANFLSVRDTLSLQRAKSFSPRTSVIESFDPIFLSVPKRAQDISSQHTIVLIPRKNSGDVFVSRAQDLVNHTERWNRISVLSLQNDSHDEHEFCMFLREKFGSSCEVRSVSSLAELAEGVSEGSFVLTERYHGAIAALALGRDLEVLAQGENDKLDAIRLMMQGTPAHGRADRLRDLVLQGELALKEELYGSAKLL